MCKHTQQDIKVLHIFNFTFNNRFQLSRVTDYSWNVFLSLLTVLFNS